jgi:hypothetical protein
MSQPRDPPPSLPKLPPLEYWDRKRNQAALSSAAPPPAEAVTSDPTAGAEPPRDLAPSPEPDRRITLPRSGPTAVGIYWVTLVVASIAVMGYLSSAHGIAIALIILFLVFPAVQLAVVLLAAFVLAFVPCSDKEYQFQRLAKIGFGALVGTIVGVAIMVVVFFAMTGAGT